jgi:hypothetical protein
LNGSLAPKREPDFFNFHRFSIGHELGHYFLEGHIDHVLPEDGMHTSYAGFVSADPYELEADQFAAGLLMPSAPFKRALARQDPGLEVVESLAGLCKTSLTATAIRYAELTEDAVAIVISTGPTIDFCFLSDTMKSLPQLAWLRKGTPLPTGTATAQLNANARRVTDGERAEADIDIMDWLGGTRSARATGGARKACHVGSGAHERIHREQAGTPRQTFANYEH